MVVVLKGPFCANVALYVGCDYGTNDRESGKGGRVTRGRSSGDASYPFVLPADKGWETDDETQDPDGGDQEPRSPRRHDLDFNSNSTMSAANSFGIY